MPNQEAILDEDERRQELRMAAGTEKEASSFEQMPPPPAPASATLPVPGSNPNVTIALPSKEAFEEMAERVSTPYSGRRGLFADDNDDDLDANTCAVQVKRKKNKYWQSDEGFAGEKNSIFFFFFKKKKDYQQEA